MRKQFAVLGLGSFGRSVALTLENMGCDVIVVDKSQETIQEISDRVTYAITADITEKEALSALSRVVCDVRGGDAAVRAARYASSP